MKEASSRLLLLWVSPWIIFLSIISFIATAHILMTNHALRKIESEVRVSDIARTQACIDFQSGIVRVYQGPPQPNGTVASVPPGTLVSHLNSDQMSELHQSLGGSLGSAQSYIDAYNQTMISLLRTGQSGTGKSGTDHR